MAHPKEQRSLIIIKPDAIQRSLLGEIVHRFERKGLNIVGMKMMAIDDVLLAEHYAHIKDKPFFKDLANFMKSSPVVVMVVAGIGAIDSIRLIVGPTKGYEADAGSIRGDFSMSTQSNIVHASDTLENAQHEIKRFFKDEELFDYSRADMALVYSEHMN